MEIENIVVADLATATGLEQLGGKSPRIHLYAGGDEKINRSMLGRLDDDHCADRAGESVFTTVIIETHPYANIRCGQFHIPAIRTASSDCCHSLFTPLCVLLTIRYRSDSA